MKQEDKTESLVKQMGKSKNYIKVQFKNIETLYKLIFTKLEKTPQEVKKQQIIP